ncbi:MAG: molybdenum cofactor biosynthesis protein MoaE [Phycisphaerae bacterium]|nr:molybdenum cofactor biosynthesis protein MoaE [Phycisphaerae bacterium]
MVLALIIDGPLTPELEARTLLGHADQLRSLSGDGTIGATLRFEGIVRRAERDPEAADAERDLLALDYQTYDPMAQRELEALAASVAARHGLKSIVALHSRGRVRVGEVSFVLQVAAPHRAESLAAVADFIDRLKQDVPIWKWSVWAV